MILRGRQFWKFLALSSPVGTAAVVFSIVSACVMTICGDLRTVSKVEENLGIPRVSLRRGRPSPPSGSQCAQLRVPRQRHQISRITRSLRLPENQIAVYAGPERVRGSHE